ncbi:hypothetical protein AJ79_02382 [Helicocarpus griseus UAMH5409]|uniref:Mid2 domain-containing protein n=1 Tax=Helicocarpus griseus UAMH5409 TaxID=1447875 RepID=A0A2B7Y2U8_9EURO|nr:hypothetical protein AJ79_02382 [Helicocarpus griseus UAMH5409]
MQLSHFYVSVFSSWASLSALAWASPTVTPPPCPSPLTWQGEIVAGVYSGECLAVSGPTQPAGAMKDTKRERRQVLARKVARRSGKRKRISYGSDGKKRQIFEEPLPEFEPLTIFPDDPDPTPFWEWEDEYTTTEDFFATTEDYFGTTTTSEYSTEEPTSAATLTSAGTTNTGATQVTTPPSTSLVAPTSLATEPATPAKSSDSKTGGIIAGSSIGGIAALAIAYLVFVAWRRSRKKKFEDNPNDAPPPYNDPPMRGNGNVQNGFSMHRVAQDDQGHSRNRSWPLALNPPDPPDDQQEQTRRQENRGSRRFYAVAPPNDVPDGSSSSSTLSSNPSTPQFQATFAYSQPSNLSEPFSSLPIVTEESSSQEHSPVDCHAPPHIPEPAAAASSRQPTTYGSRGNSIDNIRRSLSSTISRNNSRSNRQYLGSPDYDWQYVSYPNSHDIGRPQDVSPIEPNGTDSLPFSGPRNPQMTYTPGGRY